MDLTEIYDKGEAYFREKEFGRLMGYVETGFIEDNDRRILDRYTFRQQCIDAGEATTECTISGVSLETPVIMSAMTMPIPAMGGDMLLKLAEGLKTAGSLMWTGTPIPKNLDQLAAVGVPVVANIKPLRDRDKMVAELDGILATNVTWVGIEIDAGQGTKIADQEMAFDCSPFSANEIKEIKKRVHVPLVCKGVLSREDAEKCAEAGADIIVVSSHGGHTLDYLPHPLQVMDEMVAAVQGKLEIIIDGGFRRGSDVLKGLAFGASLVGLGRPILYALAAGEEQGVVDLIGGITRELERLMTMVGVRTTGEVNRDVLIER